MKMLWGGVALAALGCTDLTLEPYAPLSRLEVGPDGQMIISGEPLQLGLTVFDATGEEAEVPNWLQVDWSADDPTVIVRDGEVIGSTGSIAQVRASVAGLSNSVTVRVNPAILDVDVTIALNQANQNPYENIPLIAGRDVVFRAFVTSRETHFYEPVDIQATFRVGEEEYSTPVLSLRADEIPDEVRDNFEESYYHHIAIDGYWIQHHTVLEIVLDPAGRLDPRLGLSPNRTQMSLPVIEVPVHRQMVVPSRLGYGTTDKIVEISESLVTDSIQRLRSIFPINDLEVELHSLYRSDTDLCENGRDRHGNLIPKGWFDFINEIEVVRLAEGRDGWHYVGVVTPSYLPPVTGRCPDSSIRLGGIAKLRGRTAVSAPVFWALIHEIGHNLSLDHAPCSPFGIGGVDPKYPHDFGSIGYWGFDIAREEGFDPRFTTDIMGYCFHGLQWISPYHFDKIRRFRSGLRDQDMGEGPATLIWGTVMSSGIDLEPSFHVVTDYVLPNGTGDYTLTAIDASGEVAYQSRFTPNRLSEGDVSQFGFAIPYGGEIDRIEVRGPEGVDQIGRGTEPPMAMWWQNGEVVSIQRDFDPGGLAWALEPGSRVVISEGVPR